MLDFIKCNELLELAKEYNPILKDQSIRIIKGDEYHCEVIKKPLQKNKFRIMFSETHNKDYFYDNIGKWLKDKYNLSEAAYMLREFQEVFAFLHELGHIVGEYEIGYNKEPYTEFKEAVYYSHGEVFKQYREIPSEAFADKFAVEVMNKFTAQIYVIMGDNETIEEAQTEVDFWNEVC